MTLPWSDEQARWVFRRSATLTSRGAEPLGALVLPNAAFFPDVFDGSPKSVATLFARMKEHAGLESLETELSLVDPEEGSVTSCSTGGCSSPGLGVAKIKRIEERRDGSYALQLATSEVKNPTVLTTMMARTLGALFLAEMNLGQLFAKTEIDAAADLAAVHLGLGVLVMNGAAVELKGCSGMKIHSATSLSAGEAALALALHNELGRVVRKVDENERNVLKHLGNAAGDAYRAALGYVEANVDVVESIAKSPEAVEADLFTLRASKGWLSRALGLGRKKTDDLAELERSVAETAKTRKPVDAKKAARMAEIRALVDDTLD